MKVAFIFLLLVVVCVLQAIMSSFVNKGNGWNLNWLILLSSGMLVSGLWVLLSKYSGNLIRDALIWDVLVGMVFTLVLIWAGHTVNFGLKHWIGVIATFGVFVYWGIIK